MTTIAQILAASPVMPVVTVSNVAHAVPLARALVRGGIGVIEVTLRTEAGLDAVRAIAAEVPEIFVGAGTVVKPGDLHDAERAGAAFAISPGSTAALLAAAQHGAIPFLPGVATPSEIMAAVSAGFDHLKFFPAAALGGTNALKAFAGPFPALHFCPTGGISPDNAAGYLALPNVVCVGGSWIAPPAVIAAEDWTQVERLARDAVETFARPSSPH